MLLTVPPKEVLVAAVAGYAIRSRRVIQGWVP